MTRNDQPDLPTLLDQRGVRAAAALEAVDTAEFEVVVVPVAPDGALPDGLPLDAALVDELTVVARRFDLSRPGALVWVPSLVPATTDVLLVRVDAPTGSMPTEFPLRVAAGCAARETRARGSVLCLLAVGQPATVGEVLAESWIVGSYEFVRYRARGPARTDQTVTFWGCDDAAVDRGEKVGHVTNYARDLTNRPAGDLSPIDLETECRRVAAALGLGVDALTEDELTAGAFGGMLAVGQGSDDPPRLIEVVYEPVEGPFVALVGKGITFDAGGLALKEPTQLVLMKSDMAGAAAALAAVVVAASLGLPVNIRAYLACAENAIGPGAVRPGDVCQLRDGTTVEVNDPDAEGRLVLADALTYARQQGASILVDIATLTWGSGLGPEIFAVLGNDDDLVHAVLSAASSVGEPAWRMPLWQGYESSLASSVADTRNFEAPSKKSFNTLVGGLFLQRFAGDLPWAHLDIATTVMAEDDAPHRSVGATGSGVSTVIRYLVERSTRADG